MSEIEESIYVRDMTANMFDTGSRLPQYCGHTPMFWSGTTAYCGDEDGEWVRRLLDRGRLGGVEVTLRSRARERERVCVYGCISECLYVCARVQCLP